MKQAIWFAALLVLTFFSSVLFAQTKDFTAEATYELASGENHEDAHVFAVSQARFKVVDQILVWLKANSSLSGKGLSPSEEQACAYMLIRTRDVQEQWNGNSSCKVNFKAGIKEDVVRGIMKELMPGTAQFEALIEKLSNYRSLVDSLKTILASLTKARPEQKAELMQERQALLDEYEILDFDEKIKTTGGEKRIALYTEALQSRPNAKELYRGRGYGYTEIKQYDLALRDFTKAIELDSTDLGAYSGRASTYNSVSLEDKAIADYGRILQLDPKYSRAYSQRALIYRKQDKVDLALKDYLKAIELEPKDRYSIGAVGYIYFGKDDFDKALEYFNKEIELAPDHQNGYTSRGYIYMRQEEFDKAIADFSRALEIDPEYAHGLNYMNRGNAYLLKGDKEKARVDLEKAVQLGEYRAQALLRQLPLTK